MTPTSEPARHLALPLCGGGVIIQDRTSGGALGQLATLLGLETSDGEAAHPDAAVEERAEHPCGMLIGRTPRGLLELRWSQENGSFHLFPAPEIFEKPESGIRLWRYALVCAAIAAVLRGKPCLLLHGAMLIHDGRAVLLLGDSGVGKSTSAERWRRSGGSASKSSTA